MIIPATKRKDEVKPRARYELDVIDRAEYFTVVQFAPRGQTVKMEAKTLPDAERMATNVFRGGNTNTRDAMIYAVSNGSQALVKSLDYKGNWKEPTR